MNAQNKPQAFQVNSAEGRAYWGMGILWIMLATAEDTDGQYSCIEQLVPHGPAAGPHIHEAADETFYIMEGEATFFVEDQPIKATAGSFVSIPRGTKHAFQIDSETARLLNTYVPAGFEYTIIATTVPAEARTLPPPSIPFPDQEQANQALEQFIQQYPAAKTKFLQGFAS
ncbi:MULTISPECIES: quercetin 2,3-dioxygenase [unclassified Nostoc]|uniref:quercetin 2,3-dioxygenase n=1 Tax=unclassified Nostoc TaxID=2593658 RepID=UPI002AD51D8E|nr:quercetin 2,3-dioxygenase [Nostoc sp. DedQUE03]MDZ7972216.1 quercetin 2,3-dioxygenase [Nostoc sp. DedQUE03]MDZ8044564.1 quercetin 2,3-dioxygenase [Nostoc sp. DedQUE02]